MLFSRFSGLSQFMMCISVDLFVFILLNIYGVSWIFRVIFFIKIWNLWPLFFLIFFSSPSFSFSFYGNHVTHMFVQLVLSHRSLTLFTLLQSFWLVSVWIIFVTCLSLISCLPIWTYCWGSLVNFSFQLYFSTPKFLFSYLSLLRISFLFFESLSS